MKPSLPAVSNTLGPIKRTHHRRNAPTFAVIVVQAAPKSRASRHCQIVSSKIMFVSSPASRRFQPRVEIHPFKSVSVIITGSLYLARRGESVHGSSSRLRESKWCAFGARWYAIACDILSGLVCCALLYVPLLDSPSSYKRKCHDIAAPTPRVPPLGAGVIT